MKKYFIIASAVLAIMSSQAQFAYDYQRAANDYYAKGDYNSAAVYYEKYLTDGKGKEGPTYDPYSIQKMNKQEKAAMLSKQQSIYNLAESYRQLNLHIKAEPHYKESTMFDKTAFPLAKYRYATTLRALEKFDDAEKYFREFLSEYMGDDTYKETAQREVANIGYIKSQLSKSDLSLYTVKKAASQINTTGASYAPVMLNNIFLFTSTRPDSNAVKNNVYVNRIYAGNMNQDGVENIERLSIPQATDIHQGAVTFSSNGNVMYLTRWTITGNQKKTAIYTSRKNGKNWDEPVMMDEIINVPGSNTQQPFVVANTLYFASDRPGSVGGFDLWYATLDAAGVPSTPQNLGAINTKYDEQAPFYHTPSGTLVFSTNGRIGMGGYDFFYSKGSASNWSEPVNFGYPVNSVKDDIYFTSRGPERNILDNIYFSSDRSAECCLELFTLSKVRPMTRVSGMVVSCNGNAPISGAIVNIVDTVLNQTLFTKTTGADGKYSVEMDEVKPLKAVASAEGYLPNAVHFSKTAVDDIVLNNPTICLFEAPKVEGGAVTVDNIYYDFNKANLREESFPVLDQLVSMMNENKNMKLEIGAHTDSKGTDAYNLKLSDARAKSVIDYLIGKGVVADRLVSKGYGESDPIAENKNADGSDNPDGRQKNRRTEFKIIK